MEAIMIIFVALLVQSGSRKCWAAAASGEGDYLVEPETVTPAGDLV